MRNDFCFAMGVIGGGNGRLNQNSQGFIGLRVTFQAQVGSRVTAGWSQCTQEMPVNRQLIILSLINEVMIVYLTTIHALIHPPGLFVLRAKG